jgi:hypothetical protein
MRAYKKRLWLESIDNTTCRVKTDQAQRKLCFSGDNTLERCFGELRGITQNTILGKTVHRNPRKVL